MKKFKKLGSMVIAALLVASMITGCSGNSDEKVSTDKAASTPAESTDTKAASTPAADAAQDKKLANSKITVALWYPPEDFEKGIVQKYEELYGAGSVTIDSSYSNSTMYEKLAALVATGDVPDVFPFPSNQFPMLAQQNLYQDITPFWDKNKEIFDKAKMEYYKWDGKYYAFTSRYYMNLDMIYFNPRLFAEAGLETPRDYEAKGQWNFENFKMLAKELTKDTNGDGEPDIYGYEGDLTPAILSNNTAFVKRDDNGFPVLNFDDPALTEALQFIQDVTFKDKIKFGSGFAAGKVAMQYMNGEWWGKCISGAGCGAANMVPGTDFDFVSFPSGPNNKENILSAESYKSVGIPVGAKNPEGAAAWAELFLDYTKAPRYESEKVFTGDNGKRLYDDYYSRVKVSNFNLGLDTMKIYKDVTEGKSISSVLAEQKPIYQAAIDKVMKFTTTIIKPDQAKPFNTVKIDFESGKLDPFKATADAKSVKLIDKDGIAGKSVKLTSAVKDEWKAFLTSDPAAIKLEPGHKYKVSFDYKVTGDVMNDGKYYCKYKHSKGDFSNTEFGKKKGEAGTLSFEFDYYNTLLTDQYFELGGINVSDMVIDNFTVEAIK